MSLNPGKYKVKIDQSLGLSISPHLYNEFWTDHIEMCHDCQLIRFIPIDTRISKDSSWPKVITISSERAAVFKMEGENN